MYGDITQLERSKKYWFKPGEINKNSHEFIMNFQGGLEKLFSKDMMNPGHVITTVSNFNLHKVEMPANSFRRVDYNRMTRKREEYGIVLGEVLKSMDNGRICIDPPKRKRLQKFRLQYNIIRGFRPVGKARLLNVKLDEPIDPEGFNFTKPDFEEERFFSTEIDGIKFDFMYNRYPWGPYNFIMVPDKETLHNQYLDPEKDMKLLRAVSKVPKIFGNSVRFGFNALGAHASVNHLHWLGMFVGEEWEPPLIEESVSELTDICEIEGHLKHALWIPNLEGNVDKFAEEIHELNEGYRIRKDISYNLYYTPKGVAIFPRKTQGDNGYFELVKDSRLTTGLAFLEMAREILCPNKEEFNSYQEGGDEGFLTAAINILSIN